MKAKTIFAALAAAAALAGCRRTDIREYTLEVPGMTRDNIAKIREAVAGYEGVDQSSLSWDLENKRVTMKIDSMKVAETNIRLAIESKANAAVAHPKPSGPAGYIDERPGRTR
jgi:hypothetical protein